MAVFIVGQIEVHYGCEDRGGIQQTWPQTVWLQKHVYKDKVCAENTKDYNVTCDSVVSSWRPLLREWVLVLNDISSEVTPAPGPSDCPAAACVLPTLEETKSSAGEVDRILVYVGNVCVCVRARVRVRACNC